MFLATSTRTILKQTSGASFMERVEKNMRIKDGYLMISMWKNILSNQSFNPQDPRFITIQWMQVSAAWQLKILNSAKLTAPPFR